MYFQLKVENILYDPGSIEKKPLYTTELKLENVHRVANIHLFYLSCFIDVTVVLINLIF